MTRHALASGPMLPFEIDARDGSARAGVLRCAHGEVRTPAFVPLASNASVRGLAASEVAGLGYEMVLGNTFHLFIEPGHEHIAEMGGLHEFMGWSGPIITDSGGFQVFSMGHGSVAEEIKRRRGTSAVARALDRGGGRALPRLHRRLRAVHGPRDLDGDPGRAGLRHRAGLRRVHALPRRPRLHPPLDGAHPPLARPLRGVARRARAGGPGAVRDRAGRAWRRICARSPRRTWPGAGCAGIAIGGSLGQDKEQMREVLGWSLRDLPDEPPRHLLGIGDVDDIVHAVGEGIDTFDCATPTRLARHGTALVPSPENRWRLDLTKAEQRGSREPLVEGCPCEACTQPHPRLPALPGARPRAHRRAPDHAAQPHVHGRADARPARGDLRGPLRRARRARAGGRRAVLAGLDRSRRAPARTARSTWSSARRSRTGRSPPRGARRRAGGAS